LTKAGGGVMSGCDYLSISNSAVTPANTWYSGSNSVNGGNNTGWIFGSALRQPPGISPSGGGFLVF